ncbi:MAG: MBL fold metallo-hydrolase [Hyphomicrobiaceae bacterium]|nr:MBL fold metallo-hydrolase [Hyphomicrobiaceae bacterium]
MSVELHFHGAAGTVTGSCYRIVHPHGQFLVDCGMFQGNRTVRDLNYKPYPFDPTHIAYVLLTHAHIDHAGLLPRLTHHGFSGPIHTTEPTHGLSEFVLEDAAGIQESETERENRHRSRRGEKPFEPLYRHEDAAKVLSLMQSHDYGDWFSPGPGVRARLWNAGHILGSASIEVEVETEDDKPIRILFSGDLGPDEKVFYKGPEAPSDFDYILSESTYGGRSRPDYTLDDRREALRREINEALERGGNLIIPTFAVERSQELLHDIGTLIKSGEINPTRVFLDSPLASKVTSVYAKYASMFADMELTADELFNDDRFRIVESVDESKAINKISGGAIILSASGMCEAGRIKHHLRNNISRPNATVLFVGFQAPGTLGQIIQSGADEVRIHGERYPVRATIRSISNYSAHADHKELIEWVAHRLPAHGALFLTHGEDEARAAMRGDLMGLGLGGDQIIAPELDDYFELRAFGIAARGTPEKRRIDPRQFSRDWNNEYADFSIRLGQKLHAAKSDAERLELMKKLQDALGG